ncbi:MAG: ABC transporter ATP-binding protein [Candidatus Daviesbacteria bacterium]|nr:ABC transporter ATP-binding protein [Candidatus Daviesbacteria bacterium]
MHKDEFQQAIFTIRQVSKLLWKINPRLTILIFILSLLWGLLTFPAFYLEKLILDRIVENIGSPVWKNVIYSISFLIIGRILIELTRNIISGFLGFFRQYASKNFHIEIELLIAGQLSKLDIPTIEDPEFQDKFNKIEREAGRRAWGLVMPLTDIPNYLAGFISSVGILYFLHPLVAAGVILVSLPWIFVDRKFIKKWYDFEFEVSAKHRIRGHIAHYLIRTKNHLELRILNLSRYLISKMRIVHTEVMTGEAKIHKQQELAKTYTYIPSLLFYAGVNIYLVYLAIGVRISIGSYEFFLRSLLAASQNFSSLTSSFLEIYENYVFVSDLTWFLNLEPVINSKGGILPGKIKTGIEIKDVWFKYREDSDWILKGINATFFEGEKIAVVGENGAGKTTLIKILARFYDATLGTVTLDGQDIKKLNYPKYQGKFAVLFQDFEDYSFSARESIGFGDIDRVENLEEIMEAAKKTGIHEYIQSLPLGYENPLSPHFHKGVNLSGGQWQRVGIARMLFRKKAEILILDEPTSNVDPEAEEKIFNELMKISKNKILVFVSQRFSTVRRADKILVVDKGRVIEQGSHGALMKLRGKYAQLFSLQAKGYK